MVKILGNRGGAHLPIWVEIYSTGVVLSEENGKCVPVLSHFEEKKVTNAKYAFGSLQSP